MHTPLLFPVGEYIPAANLTILAIVYQGAFKNLTRYRVRYGCCGVERVLAHATIRKRIHGARFFCHHCGRKFANHHQDEGLPHLMRAQGFLPHDILSAGAAWPRPPSARPARIWRAQA